MQIGGRSDQGPARKEGPHGTRQLQREALPSCRSQATSIYKMPLESEQLLRAGEGYTTRRKAWFPSPALDYRDYITLFSLSAGCTTLQGQGRSTSTRFLSVYRRCTVPLRGSCSCLEFATPTIVKSGVRCARLVVSATLPFQDDMWPRIRTVWTIANAQSMYGRGQILRALRAAGRS